MLKTGYILDRRQDAVFFLALPFAAVAVALACHAWLPAAITASVALLVTIPHHGATWLRTYASRHGVTHWKTKLVLGPIAIFAAVAGGLVWAPMTLLLVAMLWDTQHSIMQQHGFTRIYDYKAGTGAPETRKYDLILNWVLYGNLFLASPFFTDFWVRELHEWGVPIAASTVRSIHVASWSATIAYLVVYAAHVVASVRRGHAVNPLKYAFLFASYFLWYFVTWHTSSILTYFIAHRLMHGLQYIVFVHGYLQRRGERVPERDWLRRLTSPAAVPLFVACMLGYAMVFNFLSGGDLVPFGLGIVDFELHWDSIPEIARATLDSTGALAIGTVALAKAAALVHYYFDSFIWKVSDPVTQEGL